MRRTNGDLVSTGARLADAGRAAMHGRWSAGRSGSSMTERSVSRGRARKPYGALLLEVVIAMAILVAAMGLLSAQLAGGLDMTVYAEDQLRASLLAEHMMNLLELDPQLQQYILEEEITEEPFDDERYGVHPGYFWRVSRIGVERGESCDDCPQVVTLQILRQYDEERPEDIDDARVVRQLVFLRMPPARIDLVEEMGVPQDVADQLRAVVPIPDFDPHSVDLHQLVSLDPETMLELMPLLTQVVGQLGASGLSGLQGQLQDALQGGGNPLDQFNPDDFSGENPEAALEKLRELAEMGEAAGGFDDPAPPAGGRRGGRRGGGIDDGGADLSDAGERRGRRGDRLEPEAREDIIGQGSGPGGEYTIEDLMRMREEYERQRRGQR